MGEQKVAGGHPVAGHQQPSAAALLHPVQVGAGRGLRASSARKRPASIRSAVPGTCTYTDDGASRSPRQIGSPTIPSLPIVPTSAPEPSAVVITSEATPSMGKYTCSIGRDAS